jgi:hypothetical protein
MDVAGNGAKPVRGRVKSGLKGLALGSKRLQFHQPWIAACQGWTKPVCPSRNCPECGSENYTFRSWSQIEDTPEQEAMIETKYRCKGSGEQWKEKVPGVLQKRSGPEPKEELGGECWKIG